MKSAESVGKDRPNVPAWGAPNLRSYSLFDLLRIFRSGSRSDPDRVGR
jgi:hypothetical protein